MGLPLGRRVPATTLARRVQAEHAKKGWGKVARAYSAAGAGRAGAAEASIRAGSVEEAKEPEYLESSLAHLTFGIVCSAQDDLQSEAQRSRLTQVATAKTWVLIM